MNTKRLGRVVTSIRVAHNESGRQMAKKLGISNVHLSHIEHGTTNISLDLVNKFREVYGVDPYVAAFEPRLEMCRVVLESMKVLPQTKKSLTEVLESLYSIFNSKINTEEDGMITGK